MTVHHHHDHDHPHDHAHTAAQGSSRKLVLALGLTLGFAAVEAVAGWMSGSLALLGDAAHMLTDSLSLGLAAGAAVLAQRPPSRRHSYGLGRAEILAAQHSLQRTAGRPPRYFRAPAGLRNPFLEPVLAALGLHLASWTRRGFDTRSGDPDRVLARLLRRLAAGDILLLHDGHAARDAGSGRPVILTVLPRLLAALDAAGLAAVPLPDAPPGERRSRP